MNSSELDKVLTYLCEDLGGDWFLTGGALVRISFDPSRGTEDMDLVRMYHPQLSDDAARNQLFRWLLQEGSGPEWVNTAVEPFVREVPGWEDETVVLRKGSKGRVLRPNLTLFTYLKLRRASDVDVADIVVAQKKCPEGTDVALLQKWLSVQPTALRHFEKHRSRLGL